MNTPQKPKDPPDTGAQPGPQHGIPDGMEDQEPKGSPNSDRHKTETTPANT